MINKNLLKSKLALIGMTQIELAKGMGTSQQTLTQKIMGRIKFNSSEIAKIKEILNLTNDEVVEIFINSDQARI